MGVVPSEKLHHKQNLDEVLLLFLMNFTVFHLFSEMTLDPTASKVFLETAEGINRLKKQIFRDDSFRKPFLKLVLDKPASTQHWRCCYKSNCVIVINSATGEAKDYRAFKAQLVVHGKQQLAGRILSHTLHTPTVQFFVHAYVCQKGSTS